MDIVSRWPLYSVAAITVGFNHNDVPYNWQARVTGALIFRCIALLQATTGKSKRQALRWESSEIT